MTKTDAPTDGAPRRGDISARKKWAFVAILLGFMLLAAELLARIAFNVSLPQYEKTRQLLAGDMLPSLSFQSAIGQAYLLYIPTPNYSNADGPQHNEQGYRGKAVPMRRTPGVSRILCLGGSTTYGALVARPESTYPAQLEAILSNDLPVGVKGVAVINGGIPYGTTAETLTHYHFKYHYYRPDLVIINPGGNDAQGLVSPYYHPDYSHWRQPMVLPQPLPPFGRQLVRSRLFSLFLIPILHGRYPNAGGFIRPDGLPPTAPWYPDAPKPAAEEKLPDIPEDEVAFKHNLETLIDEIQRDGAKVLLVPFRPAPLDKVPFRNYSPGLRQAMAYEEDILKRLSAERSIAMAPFPAEVVSPQNWMDDCHPNAAGSLEKAQHIAPYARKVLWP